MIQILFGDRIGKEGKIRLGCAAVIFDDNQENILLTQRADNGQWCLPSGGVEPGESVSEACEREVREETGLDVKITRMTSISSNPNRLVIYNVNSSFQIISLCFEAKITGGEIGLSDETIQVGFFTPAQIGDMDILAHHKQFILDTLVRQDAVFIR